MTHGFEYEVLPVLLISIPQFLLIKLPIMLPVICLLKSKELLKIKPENFKTLEFYEGEKNENSKKSIVQRLLVVRIY